MSLSLSVSPSGDKNTTLLSSAKKSASDTLVFGAIFERIPFSRVRLLSFLRVRAEVSSPGSLPFCHTVRSVIKAVSLSAFFF